MKALILEEITTSELEKHIDNIKIAVVPTGSYEQHGPNTTFATDTVRAYEIAKLLGAKYGIDFINLSPCWIWDFPSPYEIYRNNNTSY